MARNLDEILLDLEKIHYQSINKQNIFLLQNFIALFYEISDSKTDILKNIFDLYAQENVCNELEFSNIFIKDINAIEKITNDNFYGFLVFALSSVVEEIVFSLTDNFGAQENIFEIPIKFYNILRIFFNNDGIKLVVKDKNSVIEYDKIYSYVKENKSSKNLYKELSCDILAYAEQIADKNEKFLNEIKNNDSLIDFSNFTNDEAILKHAKELDDLNRILSSLPDLRIIDEVVSDNTIFDFIERLLNDNVKARNLALACLVIDQPQYDLKVFKEAIQALKQAMIY